MGEDIKNDLVGIAITHPFFNDIVTSVLTYIEELEVENKSIKEANEYWTNRYCKVSNDSILKSKVEKKIKELEEKVEELSDEQGYWGGSDLLAKIEVLQDLLEKE